ncbi:hypothetical protein ACF0H5_002688 [Mactra antiquata]
MTVTIVVDNEEALVDDVIIIEVKGLEKNQPITVRAETTEKDQVFAGSGCFTADDNGYVNLFKHASSSGTYTGVSPMGLFWSMKNAPNMPSGMRLIKNNASSALIVNLTVFSGHVTFEQTYSTTTSSLCTKEIRRWYMGNGVQKIKVKTGRIRGMLFLPPGKGPFPCVIDMFGTVGSCVEFRAALIASRGFASLALPYFIYDDLPNELSDVELEYFMEAVDWLSKHPYIDGDNLGVIGVSKGGEIALHLGYYCDKIKSVVSINGAPFFTTIPMLYKGKLIGQSIFHPEKAVNGEEGYEARNCMDCEIKNFLPIWEKDVNVLLVCGLDDRCLSDHILTNLNNCYPPDRKHLCKLLSYPGAGHLIEPPYAPLARSTEKFVRGVGGDHGVFKILWGGRTVEHAHAQEDSWKHILQHFRSTLMNTSSSSATSTGDINYVTKAASSKL